MDLYRVRGSQLPAEDFVNSRSSRYFITLTSFQPLYGKMSDIFGRKSALLFGYAVFGLGCLFCGLARNMNELVAARVGHNGEDEIPMTLNISRGICGHRRWWNDNGRFNPDERYRTSTRTRDLAGNHQYNIRIWCWLRRTSW